MPLPACTRRRDVTHLLYYSIHRLAAYLPLFLYSLANGVNNCDTSHCRTATALPVPAPISHSPALRPLLLSPLALLRSAAFYASCAPHTRRLSLVTDTHTQCFIVPSTRQHTTHKPATHRMARHSPPTPQGPHTARRASSAAVVRHQQFTMRPPSCHTCCASRRRKHAYSHNATWAGTLQ